MRWCDAFGHCYSIPLVPEAMTYSLCKSWHRKKKMAAMLIPRDAGNGYPQLQRCVFSGDWNPLLQITTMPLVMREADSDAVERSSYSGSNRWCPTAASLRIQQICHTHTRAATHIRTQTHTDTHDSTHKYTHKHTALYYYENTYQYLSLYVLIAFLIAAATRQGS